MKVLAMKKEKYLEDTKLLVQSILNDLSINYANRRNAVDNILSNLQNIQYIVYYGKLN